MSQTARADDLDTSADLTAPRLSLQAVPSEGLAAAEEPRDPNAVRSGLIGYAIGFTVSCVAITLAGTLAGSGFATSLGLGSFVGIWGGGGFGFMLGATIPLARQLDAQDHRPRPATPRPRPVAPPDR